MAHSYQKSELLEPSPEAGDKGFAHGRQNGHGYKTEYPIKSNYIYKAKQTTVRTNANELRTI